MEEIKCACCGKQLVEASNSEEFRLCLQSEPVSPGEYAVTDVADEPEIAWPHYFCDTQCLQLWCLTARERSAQAEVDRRLNMFLIGLAVGVVLVFALGVAAFVYIMWPRN